MKVKCEACGMAMETDLGIIVEDKAERKRFYFHGRKCLKEWVKA